MPPVEISSLDIDDPWEQIGCSDIIVAIDDTFIPTTSVETTVNKDGIADVKRLTEVKFPAEWDHRSVLNEIRQFSPDDQSRYSEGTVFARNPLGDNEEYHLVHHGWVRGVGSTSKQGEAKMWIDSIENLLSGIPFSRSYNDPTLRMLFDDVASVIRQKTIFEDLELAIVSDEADDEIPTPTGVLGLIPVVWATDLFIDETNLLAEKSFNASRDTVADALKWSMGMSGGKFYFDVLSDRTPVLVYETPPQTQQTFVSENTADERDGQTIRLLENNAIEEITPYNTVTVHGSSARTIGGHNVKQLQSGDFPVATATYTPLVERTGQSLQPPTVDSDATTGEGARNVARKELIELLSSDGDGDMTASCIPNVRLGDELVARPICSGEPSIPFSYEVERITHTASNGAMAKTRVNVSVFVDRSKIDVESHVRKS